MERLVDHDCDPTVVNNLGETALDLACRFGHLEVICFSNLISPKYCFMEIKPFFNLVSNT